MSMTRKVNLTPSFKPVDHEKEVTALGNEIRKIRPVAEITLEGLNELAKGKILDWQPTRKLFTVEWVKKSEKWDNLTEKSPGLRAYFKLKLFTTQLVFKSTTVRRIDETHSHFRIPEHLFHQQQRGALRVPVAVGRGSIKTPRGEFMLLDLSVGGAKIRLPENSKLPMNVDLGPCELRMGTLKINSPKFTIKVARSGENIAGIRFAGLEDRHKSLIKQFLIDALRAFYEEMV